MSSKRQALVAKKNNRWIISTADYIKYKVSSTKYEWRAQFPLVAICILWNFYAFERENFPSFQGRLYFIKWIGTNNGFYHNFTLIWSSFHICQLLCPPSWLTLFCSLLVVKGSGQVQVPTGFWSPLLCQSLSTPLTLQMMRIRGPFRPECSLLLT